MEAEELPCVFLLQSVSCLADNALSAFCPLRRASCLHGRGTVSGSALRVPLKQLTGVVIGLQMLPFVRTSGLNGLSVCLVTRTLSGSRGSV